MDDDGSGKYSSTGEKCYGLTGVMDADPWNYCACFSACSAEEFAKKYNEITENGAKPEAWCMKPLV